MKLVIEKHSAWDNKFNEIPLYEKSENKIEIVYRNVKKHFSTFPSLKFGRGGSHIWFADAKTNERLAIVYF